MHELELPTARDWMTKQFLAFTPDSDIFEAVEKLAKGALSAAPIVDEQGKLLGMLTEKDGLRALSQLLYSEQAQKLEVREHMSPNCQICEPQMDLFRVTELFLACNFPALPVVENDQVIGIIDRTSQLECMESFREELDRQRQVTESAAGTQADRPRGIGALQQAAGSTTKEQLVRLFGRRTN